MRSCCSPIPLIRYPQLSMLYFPVIASLTPWSVGIKLGDGMHSLDQ